MLPKNIASIIIDAQPTFCEGGGLAVNGGNAIMRVINGINRLVQKRYWTKDWHPAGHSSFASTHGREPFTQAWLRDGQIVAEFEDGVDGPEGAILQRFWTDHGIQGTEEAELHPDLNVHEDDLILLKGDNPLIDSYSCVFENDKQTRPKFSNGHTLPEQLRHDGIDTVMLSGLALDVCVRDGALDLKAEGFRVIVVLDATAAISPEGMADTLEKFQAHGIEVMYSHEVQRKLGLSTPSPKGP